MNNACLIHNARQSLAIARALISGNTDPVLARIARRYIARSRALWALASRHTYKRVGNAWRAIIVDACDVTTWESVRTYGKRQSAQRAARAQLARGLH